MVLWLRFEVVRDGCWPVALHLGSGFTEGSASHTVHLGKLYTRREAGLGHVVLALAFGLSSHARWQHAIKTLLLRRIPW